MVNRFVIIRTTVDQWSRNSSQKTQLYLYVQPDDGQLGNGPNM